MLDLLPSTTHTLFVLAGESEGSRPLRDARSTFEPWNGLVQMVADLAER